MLTDCYLQHYSMDCYFRQYWRDTRLSFKGLKMNSNQLHINQLSLNVKMLGRIVPSQQDPKLIILYLICLEMAVFCQTTALRAFPQRRFGSQTRISTTAWTPTFTRSPGPTSCSEYPRMETSLTPCDWPSRPGARWCCPTSRWTGSPVLSSLVPVSRTQPPPGL